LISTFGVGPPTCPEKDSLKAVIVEAPKDSVDPQPSIIWQQNMTFS